MAADQDMWSSPEERRFSRFSPYCSYPARLSTFANPRDDSSKRIARAGFYHFNGNLHCYFCRFRVSYRDVMTTFLDNWSALNTIHSAHNPRCREALGEEERERMRESLEARIESFRGRVMENAPTPESMARAGFFLLSRRDTVVQCPFCRLRVQKWPSKKNPLAYHAQVSPHCSFVIRYCENHEEPPLPPRAISLGPLNNSNRPLHPQYSSESDRRLSFRNWPKEHLDHSIFAKAGLFFTGNDDIVQCFYCGGGLQNWQLEDSPIQIHRMYYPNCKFAYKIGKNAVVLPLQDRCEEAMYSTDAVKRELANLIDASTPDAPEEPPEDEDSLNCSTCISTVRQVIFLPCCHALCCVKCSKQVSTCPSCRVDICRRAKFFL